MRNWRGSKQVLRGDEGRGLTNPRGRGYIIGRRRSEGEDTEIQEAIWDLLNCIPLERMQQKR